MKRLLFLATAATLLMTSACKKKDDNNTNPSGGSWKVGNTTYTVKTCAMANAILSATDATLSNSFSVVFTTTPTTSGTYKIVGGVLPQNANEVTVNLAAGANGYSSTGSGNVNATVTVSGGKVSVTIPQIYVIGNSDSTTASGSITQL